MSYLLIRDVKLYTKVIGDGYPILVMHGGPGLDHTYLLSLNKLSNRFKIIYYDHRCNGRSTVAKTETLTFENCAADTEALRKQLGIDKWAIIGHSFGGMVALEYALRYPNHLSHLILLDTGSNINLIKKEASKQLIQLGYNKIAIKFAHRLYNGQLNKYEIFVALLLIGNAYFYKTTLQNIVQIAKGKNNISILFKWFKNISSYDWDVSLKLKGISCPTLVIAGIQDFLFPPKHQQFIAEQIPNSKLKIIEYAGHYAPLEKTKEIVDIVQEFMSCSKIDNH